jgi:hypothetical protein
VCPDADLGDGTEGEGDEEEDGAPNGVAADVQSQDIRTRHTGQLGYGDPTAEFCNRDWKGKNYLESCLYPEGVDEV